MASITFTNAGGITVTGGINFNNVSNAVKYTSSYGTEFNMIRFKDNPDNSNGSGIVIGGGGLTVIGGGESADTIANQYSSGITEAMIIGNDGPVTVYSNLQSGWGNQKTFTFGTDGVLTASGFSGNLSGNATSAESLTYASRHQVYLGYGARKRILKFGNQTSHAASLGSSIILSVSVTWGSMVHNCTWLIETSHPGDDYYTKIIQLGCAGYSRGTIYVMCDSNGAGYIDYYIASGTSTDSAWAFFSAIDLTGNIIEWYDDTAGGDISGYSTITKTSVTETPNLTIDNYSSYTVPKTGGTFTGAISATSFNATSARAKKENILPTALNAIDLLNSVNVVNFTFKDDEKKIPKIGFIADDTDSLLATPNHDQMDVTNCIGVLIKAVQELSEQNKQLKKEIDELKKERI